MAKRSDKIKDFRKMDKKELLGALADKREKLRQMRFNMAAGKIKNVKEIRETRKDIARLMGILKQNEK